MQITTKTVKVFQLAPNEAERLKELIDFAQAGENMRELRISPNTYIAVDIDQRYAYMTPRERHQFEQQQFQNDGLNYPPKAKADR